MDIKKWIKSSFPAPIVTMLRYFAHPYVMTRDWYLIKTQPLLHKRALARLKKKDGPINIVFFAIYASVWKYDALYKLLEADSRFNPIVLVCPVVNRGREHMLETLNACYGIFKQRGYNVICSYDETTNTYLDARSLNPDIIFYTNPYKNLIDDRYYITQFRDIITCYAPYGYAISAAPTMLFDQLLHNMVYVNFYETSIHKDLAMQYARNKGANVIVVGSLLSDEIVELAKERRTDGKKIIIWAPHHTIEDDGFSCFCVYCDLILELMDTYKNQIYWVFKPHPLLKPKLYNHQDWGRDKTDAYYNVWHEVQCGEIQEGDYSQLFVDSDAMIFDSISFMAEYYFTHNPSLFTVRTDKVYQKFNQFGIEVFNLLYHGSNRGEIIHFVEKVLAGEDSLKNERDIFFDKFLARKSASNYVYEYISSILL